MQRIRLEDVLRDCGYAESAPAYKAILRELDLTKLEAKKSLWQADHVRAVEDGGGDDLKNIQTLCVRCHKAKNGRQASYRAKPRAFRPIKPAGFHGVDGFRGIGGRFDD